MYLFLYKTSKNLQNFTERKQNNCSWATRCEVINRHNTFLIFAISYLNCKIWPIKHENSFFFFIGRIASQITVFLCIFQCHINSSWIHVTISDIKHQSINQYDLNSHHWFTIDMGYVLLSINVLFFVLFVFVLSPQFCWCVWFDHV